MAAALSLGGQWLHTPTPNVPRTPDGKPDLAAPPPKAADGHPLLSGVWAPNSRALQDLSVGVPNRDVPYQPWSAQVAKERANGARGKDDPAASCVPGMPKLIVLPYPYKIMQMPGVTVILYEGFTTFRQIFTDGRKLPADPSPAWQGYSVGRWEGDTLVIDTAGFNDRGWLDARGTGHSEDMRVEERFRRRDYGHLDLTITVTDPKIFTQPIRFSVVEELLPDTDVFEHYCLENERDDRHFPGRAPR